MRPYSSGLLTAMLLVGASLLTGCGNDSTTPDTPPAAPTGLAFSTVTTTSLTVSWNQVSGATSYELDRAEGASGTFATIGTGLTATVYNDSGLTAGTLYRYRARAVGSGGTSDNSSEASQMMPAQPPKVATVTGVPLDRTFYSDTLYILQGYVKVSNGATLTIQAGTKIVGDTLVTGSSLWILRGSQIMANGTASDPVVFTSQRTPGNRKPGDWGGIIIVGNAPINRTASPIFTEGPTGAAEDYSGGNDFNDSSGKLNYVRVEFAGYDVSNGGGQELNSISNYAVGRGTQYDYVQAIEGLDDGFESFGGGQDMRHMISWETGDDHFDWTEGFQGRAQYLLAIQTTVPTPRPGTGTVSSDPRGFEGDGCEIDKAGCTFANTPYSMPIWMNFTVLGPGTGVFSTNDGNGAVVRRGAAANFVNGIIGRWPGVGMSIRDQESMDLVTADSTFIRNVILSDNGSNFEPSGTNFGSIVADSATEWSVTTPALTEVFSGPLPTSADDPTDATLGVELKSGAAAETGGLSDFTGTVLAPRVTDYFGGSMEATDYIGAADPSAATQWYQGWTEWYRN